MSTRELHQTDLTRPPPPIDDTFPHPTLLEQVRVDDDHLVQKFLATLPSIKSPSNREILSNPPATVIVSTYREELREALHVLQTLKHSKLVLEDLKADDPRWKEEMQRTEQLKTILLHTLAPLEEENRKQQLKLRLTARQKKRAWQKRRNKRLETDRAAEQRARERRLQDTAQREMEWKERLNQERIAREELAMKTHILTDVRCRKARAKRLLGRFEKSLRLRQQRQNTRNVDAQQEEYFSKRMVTLITEWKGKLKECVKEERRLKDELNRQTAGNETRRRENRWRKVLFGTAAQSGTIGRSVAGHHSEAGWWEELVSVRRAWDRFCLPFDPNSNAGGSVAPATWIVPPEHPLPGWAVYREEKKKAANPKGTTSGTV